MTTISFSLVHQARQPKQRGQAKPPLIVLLHGLGADEFDLFELAPMLNPNWVVVSARAPHEYGPGFAWFHINFESTELRYDLDEIAASRGLIAKFVGECVVAYGADAGRVFLMGFSQGAMMAANVAAHTPELAQGIVCMSGAMLPAPAAKPIPTLNALVVHGVLDGVVPVERGRGLRDALAALGADVRYHEYVMRHEITGESFAQVKSWLDERAD